MNEVKVCFVFLKNGLEISFVDFPTGFTTIIMTWPEVETNCGGVLV